MYGHASTMVHLKPQTQSLPQAIVNFLIINPIVAVYNTTTGLLRKIKNGVAGVWRFLTGERQLKYQPMRN